MKKFDIKKLFILVLAVALVFSLAACGGNEDNGGNGGGGGGSEDTDGVAFFNGLWEAAKGIGNVAVDSSKDLVVNLGLTVEAAKYTGAYKAGTTVFANDYKLDVDVDLIYDQDVASGATDFSAVRVSIADTASGNLLTVYYALATPEKAYFDFMGTKVQVAIDVDSNEAGTEAANDMLTAVIAKFFSQSDLGGKSLEEYIALFTDKFGANFTLNDIVVVLLNLFNVDLNELLTNPSVSGIITGIAPDFVPPAPGQNVDLLPLIISVADALVKEDSLVAENNVYKVEVASMVRTVLGGFIDKLFDPGALFLGYSTVSKTDKSIDTFFIEGYSNALGTAGTTATTKSGLYVKIVIDELNVRNTTATATSIGAFDATQYKEMELTAEVVASVPDAFGALQMNFDTTMFEEYDFENFTSYDLNGAVKVTLTGGVNFLGEGGNTNAVAKIYYKADGATETFAETDLVAEAVYFTTGGRGTLRVDAQKAIETAGVPENLVKTAFAAIANAFKNAPAETPEKAIYDAFKAAIANDVAQIEISNIKLPKMLWNVLGWNNLLEMAQDYTGVIDLPDPDPVDPEEIGGETVIAASNFKNNVGVVGTDYANKYWKDANEDGKIVPSELWNLATIAAGAKPAFALDINLKNIVGMVMDALGSAGSGNYGLALNVENKSIINLLMNVAASAVVADDTKFVDGGLLAKEGLLTYIDFIAAIYKGDQNTIVRMTDAGIIAPASGTKNDKATCVYKTPDTITKADAKLMVAAAMDTDGDQYEESIVAQINALFKGSVFAGTATADNVNIFLTLLNSKATVKLFGTDKGANGSSLTADVTYKLASSTAAAHVNVTLTAKAVNTAYAVANKDIFDATKATVQITFDAAGTAAATVVTTNTGAAE